MKKVCKISFLVITMLIFITGSSFATKPGEDVNPNGFPSGFHYNLNILGKKDTFTCPATMCDYDIDPDCTVNVIYIPVDNTDPVEILMESGKKKTSVTELDVTDWCTQPFDNDGAVVQIPSDTYNAYARALAKPTFDPNIAILGNSVSYVTDENGHDLYYLGSFSKSCVTTPDIPECNFTRTKGKSKATNITALLEFTGDICYFDPTSYCDPLADPLDPSSCPATSLCCTEVNIGTDLEPIWVYRDCVIKDPLLLSCDPQVEVTGYCKDYENDPTSIFTVGDFVGYLWSMDNNGVKLLQIRFYPQ
jgi:hypothetical protein